MPNHPPSPLRAADDPAAAALDLIVRAAAAIHGGASGLRAALGQYVTVLDCEDALTGVADLADARRAAAAILHAVLVDDDLVASLRLRAALLRVGCDDPRCTDAVGLARALDAAATVLDRL